MAPPGENGRGQFMFMPHIPPPQNSLPQAPDPHSIAGAALLEAPERAAKVEYCVVRWS